MWLKWFSFRDWTSVKKIRSYTFNQPKFHPNQSPYQSVQELDQSRMHLRQGRIHVWSESAPAPPFWHRIMQIQPILGHFWAILELYQPPGPPPLLDLGLPFLHILDPPLTWGIHCASTIIRDIQAMNSIISPHPCIWAWRHTLIESSQYMNRSRSPAFNPRLTKTGDGCKPLTFFFLGVLKC